MLVSSVVASESGRLPLISIFEQGKQVLPRISGTASLIAMRICIPFSRDDAVLRSPSTSFSLLWLLPWIPKSIAGIWLADFSHPALCLSPRKCIPSLLDAALFSSPLQLCPAHSFKLRDPCPPGLLLWSVPSLNRFPLFIWRV